jgi:hypothetical protein
MKKFELMFHAPCIVLGRIVLEADHIKFTEKMWRDIVEGKARLPEVDWLEHTIEEDHKFFLFGRISEV